MSAALTLVTLTPYVLMYLVHSLVLVTVDSLEMGSLVKVSFKNIIVHVKTSTYIHRHQ